MTRLVNIAVFCKKFDFEMETHSLVIDGIYYSNPLQLYFPICEIMCWYLCCSACFCLKFSYFEKLNNKQAETCSSSHPDALICCGSANSSVWNLSASTGLSRSSHCCELAVALDTYSAIYCFHCPNLDCISQTLLIMHHLVSHCTAEGI